MGLKIEDFTFPLTVSKRTEETPLATSFAFEIPKDLESKFKYESGQFVSFFLDINGETLSRSYSLSSAPGVDSEFQVTVKRVPGGKGSNFLCDHVQVGHQLRVAPPSGHFFKFKEGTTNFVLFGGGSGITPLYSILKYVLAKKPEAQVTLVYANRSEDQIIYKEELKSWAEKYSSRFQIHHLLSQPTAAWETPTSKITADWIKAFAKNLNPKTEVYVCGPDGYMELCKNSLLQLDFPKDLLHQESFTTTASTINEPAKDIDGKTLIGNSPSEESEIYEVTVTLQGESKVYQVKKNDSILEALIEAGDNPPYSCMDGACMACMAKVEDGLVMQEDPGILTQENIDVGECLTCQAKPRAQKTKITYDIF
ncbi:ferredoxin--NADP reductase [bacterium]|nr:ferredoxin--NADP reductase [bacterium]